MNFDGRRHSPSCDRNRAPILEVLRRILPRDGGGVVLEIASGTGQHAAWFAREFPHLTWQPSDADAGLHGSIAAWIAHEGATNARAPLVLDVATAWPEAPREIVAMLNINMVHIAPWHACEGLMAKAGELLPPGAPLLMYGPFARGGRHTAPSNEAFDRGLRARDPEWGVRDLEDVVACAAANGLDHVETIAMPANNLSVVYRRRQTEER